MGLNMFAKRHQQVRSDSDKLEKQEEYGRVITPEEAQATIQNISIIDKIGKLFLEAYHQHVDLDTMIAIRHKDSGIFEDYLIAKSKYNKRVEVTIKGGVIGGQPTLGIGLQYDGNDTEFQPNYEVGKGPEPEQKRLISKLAFWKKCRVPEREERTRSEKFPLATKSYGATIYPTGRIEHLPIDVGVTNWGLAGLTDQLYQSIKI